MAARFPIFIDASLKVSRSLTDVRDIRINLTFKSLDDTCIFRNNTDHEKLLQDLNNYHKNFKFTVGIGTKKASIPWFQCPFTSRFHCNFSLRETCFHWTFYALSICISLPLENRSYLWFPSPFSNYLLIVEIIWFRGWRNYFFAEKTWLSCFSYPKICQKLCIKNQQRTFSIKNIWKLRHFIIIPYIRLPSHLLAKI